MAIIKDPYTKKMHVFTRMPGKEVSEKSLKLTDRFQKGLVRVYPILPENINDEYLADHVWPKVREISSPNPPKIESNEEEAWSLSRFAKEEAVSLGINSAVNIGAFGVGYAVLSRIHAAHPAATSGLGFAALAASAIGPSMNFAVSATSDLFKKFTEYAATRKDAKFEESGEAIYGLEGRSSMRVSGVPLPSEVDRLRRDPSASVPGWA